MGKAIRRFTIELSLLCSLVMVRAMRWIGDSLRGLSSVRRMQWMFSMLAIVGCIWSVATVHSHDDGLHALDSACISCDLEDIVSHGAVAVAILRPASNLTHIQPAASQAIGYIAVARVSNSIRAPPVFS